MRLLALRPLALRLPQPSTTGTVPHATHDVL